MTEQPPPDIGDDDIVPAPIAVPVAGEDEQRDPDLPSNLPILPSRDAVLYPGMLLPLQATDQRWVRLLNDAVSARQPVGITLQRDPADEVVDLLGLYQIGTAANIVRLLKLPDGSLQVLLQGLARVRLTDKATQAEPYLRADITVLPWVTPDPISVEMEGLIKSRCCPTRWRSPRRTSTIPADWPTSSRPTSTSSPPSGKRCCRSSSRLLGPAR